MTRAVRRQHGAALLVLLCTLAASVAGTMLIHASASYAARQREAITATALARAHQALLAYAIAVSPDTAAKRPGDLPCPDLDNDGSAELTCTTAAKRLGRLPWRTLDLDDLRDGDGERLWYALSGRFDRTTFNQCPVSGGPNCLNSDTPGTLTVRDSAGGFMHDGSDGDSGAIAVVISPGAPLVRVGSTTLQERSCSGDAAPGACSQSGKCSGPVTALCDPGNYLDRMAAPVLPIAAAIGGAEDNADFDDGDAGNGFVQGPIRDAAGQLRLNDRLRVLGRNEFMPALERRVASHVMRCLSAYAAGSSARLPWAAAVSAPFGGALPDQDGLRFGRVPTTLSATAGYPGMMSAWPADCPLEMTTPQHTWWANWKDQVFHAIADSYAPDAASTGCGACLAVDPPAATADKQAVVIVAGRALPGQVRATGATAADYLEAGNAGGGPAFTRLPLDPDFNDTVLYW